MTDRETLRVEERADRVVVTLSGRDHGNALRQQRIDELHRVLEALERDAGRGRVLILTGSGRVFTAGADIDELRDRRRDDALRDINLRLFERLRDVPTPAIAAVDGDALDGGAELAYAADVRVASTGAVFGQPGTRLGIMAAAGGAFRLERLVGEGLARDLLLTGRSLSGSEALACGLVTRLVEADELLPTAHEVADQICDASPFATRLTKLALNAWPGAHPTFELVAQAVLFKDDEQRDRMDAFLSRRTAKPTD